VELRPELEPELREEELFAWEPELLEDPVPEETDDLLLVDGCSDILFPGAADGVDFLTSDPVVERILLLLLLFP
jgi:hypothetical protein